MLNRKSLLVVSLLTILMAGLTASAQVGNGVKKGDLKALAGKTRVFVVARDDAARNRIANVLRSHGKLTIVENANDADFYVEQTIQTRFHSTRRYEATRDLPQLPDSDREMGSPNRSGPGSVTRYIGTAKIRVEAYFKDAEGTRVIVWSKDRSRRFSDSPVVPVAWSADHALRTYPSRSGPQTDDAALTGAFVEKLEKHSR